MIEIPARHRFETMSASRPDAASRDEEAPHPLRPVDVDASLDLLGTLLDRPAIQDAPVDNRALWRWLRRWFHLESTWRQGIETSLTELPTSAFRFNRAAELLRLELVALYGLEVAWSIARTVALQAVDPQTGDMVRVTITGEPYFTDEEQI